LWNSRRANLTIGFILTLQFVLNKQFIVREMNADGEHNAAKPFSVVSEMNGGTDGQTHSPVSIASVLIE
jgi:hypothetical protein